MVVSRLLGAKDFVPQGDFHQFPIGNLKTFHGASPLQAYPIRGMGEMQLNYDVLFMTLCIIWTRVNHSPTGRENPRADRFPVRDHLQTFASGRPIAAQAGNYLN
jgi:hypothetical protein